MNRQDRQQVLGRSERLWKSQEWGVRRGESLHITQDFCLREIEGLKTAPYSSSSSSYNSLYLLLLNLKEKNGNLRKRQISHWTHDKKRKRERGKEYLNVWQDDRPKKEEKTWKDDEKEGKADRDWAEDLLRVFPPWVEGMAGPVLVVCRLAGSKLTLGGEEEQQEVKVKGHRKVRKTTTHKLWGDEWRREREGTEPKTSWGRNGKDSVVKSKNVMRIQFLTEIYRRSKVTVIKWTVIRQAQNITAI